MRWYEIDGWFRWRSAQEEAAARFPNGSSFVEVGIYLGRSLCSLAELAERSGKNFTVIGVDTCLGSGPEGPNLKDFHGAAVAHNGGTLAGALHRNVLDCGYRDAILLIIASSVSASRLFSDESLDWVHLDACHDYNSVKTDIQAWLPKVKTGGWLSGDDYDQLDWPGVCRAVEESLPGATAWSNRQWRWIVSRNT